MSDPVRWRDLPDPPEGALELVRSLEPPPALPPDLRAAARPPSQPSSPLPRRWIAPTALAAALVIGALVVWRWAQPDAPAPPVALEPEVEAVVEEAMASVGDDEGDDDDEATPPELGAPPSPPEAEAPAPRAPRRARRGMERVAPAPDARGSLAINSLPYAVVLVDGVRIGRTPIRRHAVPSGEHVVALETDDGRRYETQVRVRPGETSRVIHRFRERAERSPVARTDHDAPDATDGDTQAGHGTLVVNTMPWARVIIGGEHVGNTPLRIALPAGDHEIVLEPAGGPRRRVRVTIRDGETTRRIMQLSGPSGAERRGGEWWR